MKLRWSGIAATMAALCAGGTALADYPERPITMIVSYSAGGGTDIAARTLVPYIERYLGDRASITVINRPGAAGELGFTELSRARPDGYTIGFINTPNILTIPIQRNARYSLQDITPIARAVYDPGAFSVLPQKGITNLEELIAFARENPRTVTYGTTGIGSDDHIAALMFERMNDIQLEHVPFPGNADVRAAVLGGHVFMASMNVSETIADHHEGRLVLLGQMADERWKGAPEIPTFAEQGHDIVFGSDRGIGAPAGLPDDVRDQLAEAVAQALQDPEFIQRAEQQDLPLDFLNAGDFLAELERLDASLRGLWENEPWSD
ncbi:MAG: tripartite tricarboxylate transporter substrate binding protein [Paracoccus sp. (in: a-proteobacteria)]|nr:tripartite tricarboxylate transporter substrate binding protein [Paracoccus sp. (in: a-proteobacteria)]